MKNIKNLSFLLAILAFPSALSAAVLTESATAPGSAIISQADFSGGFNGNLDYSDNSGAPAQSFTTGALPFTLGAVTVKGAGSSGGLSTVTWTINLSTVSAGVLTVIAQETTNTLAITSSSNYLTFTLDTPVALAASTVYAYSIYESGSFYAFAKSSANDYAGGEAFNHGSAKRMVATGDLVMNPQAVDRTFYLQAIPEPSTYALMAVALGGLVIVRKRFRKA